MEASDSGPVDLWVVNSCTVTDSADRECIASIRDLHARHPSARIVVTGCLVQRDADRLKNLAGVALLAGPQQKHRIGEWVDALDPWVLEPRIETELASVYAPLEIGTLEGVKPYGDRSKAFVKIQDGCDRSCAFCKIPYVRGRSRSRPLADVLEEVGRLVDHGFQEIVLTGVAIGLWGREWSPTRSLADLVEAVAERPGRFRLRLSSLDPRDLDERLIEALAASPKVCRHLHLSLQSGSDPVLNRMNRGYTTEEYHRRVERVREHWPDLGLTTDLIVGFPGETEEQFQQTLDFCRRILFAKVHIFPYSRRKGTSAFLFKGHLDQSLVKQRACLLRQTVGRLAAQFNRCFVGTVQEVLVEQAKEGLGNRCWEGATSQFIPVRFSGPPDQKGKLVTVYINDSYESSLSGKFFSCTP